MTLTMKDLQNLQKAKLDHNIEALAMSAYNQNDREAYRALACYKETKCDHYAIAFLRFCNYSYADAEFLWNNIQHYKFSANGGVVDGKYL